MASKDLVGSVFERKSSSNSSGSNVFKRPTGTGFPSAQHRSKSAFARAREQRQQQQTNATEQPQSRSVIPPVISGQKAQSKTSAAPSVEIRPSLVASSDNDNESPDWRAQMSAENEARVANMTEEEREEERKQIFEQFGPGIADILRRARERLERTAGDPEEPSHGQNLITRVLKSTLM